jgi:predicted nucleic-acid-binding protein
MNTYIIDTNALLSFVTDRNAAQQAIIAELFERAAALDCEILCHVHVMTEFVYVLEKVYGQDKRSIRQMVMDLIATPGIVVLQEIDFEILLDYWPNAISDFGDAVVASLSVNNRQGSIVTFDKRFIKEMNAIGIRIYTAA